MLGNLRLVLRQYRKFLAIFFFIVFLPSIILAVLGIRAIQNERFKLRHQNQQLQITFVATFQKEVLSLIERNTANLREISTRLPDMTSNHSAIPDLLSQRSREPSLLGHTVIWKHDQSPWIPDLQENPSLSGPWTAPLEWEKWQQELANAEAAEFRRQNYQEAIRLYTRISVRAQDGNVRAWILSRIARCQAKNQHLKQALSTYRSILADFSDLRTESGRPLAPLTSLQVLDTLRSDNDLEGFIQESSEIYAKLEQNTWSLDGEQLQLYANMLQEQIDRVAPGGASPSRESLQTKLEVWRAAAAVKNDILPGFPAGGQIQRESIAQDGREFLVLILPVAAHTNGTSPDFIGSLISNRDVFQALDLSVASESLSGATLLLRSMLSGKIIYRSGPTETSTQSDSKIDMAMGAESITETQSSDDAAAKASGVDSVMGTPVHADIFPENFPPWRVEVYENESEMSFSLHKNIFFWTILALLIILFMGSGLIIRTIVQEVNLLNLKSDFIASVSHEFKTPLTAMGAILERLLDDEVKDPLKAREYYRILSHDSDRLKRLVKNVLDFTKIEEGKRRYRLSPVDIAHLVRREVESFENENKLAGFSVRTEIPDDIPRVQADEEAINQALHNILDNAAKFSLNDKIIALEVLSNTDTIEIAVQDRGIGIPENEQKKIFEKFFRGKSAASVSPTGTGLGLTLVKHIMMGHNGDIKIQSQPGEGSRVSLVLPIEERK